MPPAKGSQASEFESRELAPDPSLQKSKVPRWLSRFSIGLTIWTLFVILWGALVRASGSGDGCGAHWPLCDGQVIPADPTTERIIEFVHRLSTTPMLPATIFGLWLAWKYFEPKHQARRMAVGAFLFTITEALVGAGLVLKSLTGDNTSTARAVMMALHLINTFVLLYFLVGMAWHFSGRPAFRWKNQGAVGAALVYCVVGMLLMGTSGAIAALGDTLYPSKTFLDGVRHETSGDAPMLLVLRLWHPVVTTTFAVMTLLFMRSIAQQRQTKFVTQATKRVSMLVFAGMGLGIVNVLLAAPIWMQLVHLLFANLLWISIVLTIFNALPATQEPVDQEAESRGAVQPDTDQAVVAVPMWKAYLSLTKPRVISLLLFTTLAAMFIAQGGWPGGWLFLAVAIGGYAAAGAANAINMVYDRDIDIKMARTANRPTVTSQISSRNALLFAAALATLSVALLWGVGNFLAAAMAMSGLLFYVFIYTMGLKRRTPQNIVIGGAAGAFPPLVGYAAVTGDLPMLAWVLFALIFVWTPVHFWALALLIKDDYADAGVPMLPVVKGDKATVMQIGVYTVLTAGISLIPLMRGEARSVYLASAIVLNTFLVIFTYQLMQRPERPQALKVFKYSMIYLALLFFMIAVDRSGWM